ncbi:MAG: class II aldolase/adducin family protein [Armatimonadota bacterium]
MSDDPRSVMAEICYLLATQRLTSATGGNVSMRLPDGTFWVTPSRLHKRRVKAEELVRIDDAGNVLEGTRTPTSEVPMHLAAFRALPCAGAVIHAHPPFATGYALACMEMETVSSSEAYAILGSKVPLIGYARPSTDGLAQIIEESVVKGHKAYLMANHGVLTWGADLWEAFDVLDTLEMYAHSLFTATILGGAVPLSEDECAWLAKKFAP